MVKRRGLEYKHLIKFALLIFCLTQQQASAQSLNTISRVPLLGIRTLLIIKQRHRGWPRNWSRWLSLAKIEAEILDLPPKRTNKALETGLLDFDIVSPSWFTKQDLGPLFVKSTPIIQITEYVVTLPENVSQYRDISQMKGKEVGTVRGYLYHDDQHFIRTDFASEQELIKALDKHRVKAIIAGNYPALYWSAQLGIPVALAAVYSDGDLVFRLRKEHAALLPAINQAIATLKANGNIDEIIKKYTKSKIS